MYNELRELAEARLRLEAANHTFQRTALVHEVFLRLKRSCKDVQWQNRAHFFSVAAEAMRRILVESARAKQCAKRGGGLNRVPFVEFQSSERDSIDDLLDVNSAIGDLAHADQEAAALVKLRLFGGLSVAEAGKMLGISRTAAYENWHFARSWFAANLGCNAEE